MIFNRCIFVACFFPMAVFSASQPCGLSEFEPAGKGWLSAKSPGLLKYVVSRRQFESASMPKSWTVSLQAREAALDGFSQFFRKISPPTADKGVFSIKGMQAKEMQCVEGFFIFYEVNVSNLAWEASTVSVSQPKEENDQFTNNPMATDLQVGMPAAKQTLVTPKSVPKVLIED